MINPPQGCDDRVRGSHRIAIESEQTESQQRSFFDQVLVPCGNQFSLCQRLLQSPSMVSLKSAIAGINPSDPLKKENWGESMIAMNKVEVTREQDWKNTFDNVYFFVVALFEISSFFIANGIPVYNKKIL